MFRKLVIVFFVLLNFSYAQSSSDDVTQQIWTDYNPQWNLNENYTFYGSLGYRTIIPYSWTKLYFTSAVRFAPDPLFELVNKLQQEVHFGLNFYYTFNEDKTNQIELRPFQGYKISWPNLERIKVSHTIRLDERFIFTIGEDDFTFDLVARYKIEAIFHRTKHLVDFADGFYFPISVEFFIKLYSNEQYNDAIRVTPGLGYSSSSERWKIQFDLSYQYSKNEEESDFTKNTIIYRLRFYQAL
jgi:hypothetical protein